MNLVRKKKNFEKMNRRAISLAAEICLEDAQGQKNRLRGTSLAAFAAVSEMLVALLWADGVSLKSRHRNSPAA